MINLPVEAFEILEKVVGAEDEFVKYFKSLSIAGSGRIVVPPENELRIHTGLLLHIVANLVEAQTEIAQLKGQLAILKVDKEDEPT